MPLYEYACERCEEQFEILRSSSDKEEVKCPKCDGPARKLLSSFAVGSSSSGAGGRSSCSTGSSGGFGGG